MAEDLWQSLLWPLARLLAGLSFGLFAASLLEALKLSDWLAGFVAPLARLGRFSPISGAAFTLAFISPASANALLSDAREKNEINMAELTLANIFNSFPAALLHLPTLFFLLWPALGSPAAIYVGLSLLAALARACLTLLSGHLILRGAPQNAASRVSPRQLYEKRGWRAAFLKARMRFLKRLPRLLLFTIPIYILMYLLQRNGFFESAEEWLARTLPFGAFLKPEVMGIIIFSLAAELGAAIGAAGSLLQSGALNGHEIVIALLAGNILSTPMRAIRHQLPAYAGYYRPLTALWLVAANQIARAFSMIAMLALYAL